MKIELRHFCEPSAAVYRDLLNSTSIRKHMPLSEEVSEEWCEMWMRQKSQQWDETGTRGPWSIWLDGKFAGWGGLQPDEGHESAIAIVLSKRAWGNGRAIMREILRRALEVGFSGTTLIELPPTRRAGKLLAGLGAREIASSEIQGHRFNRYEVKLTVLFENL